MPSFAEPIVIATDAIAQPHRVQVAREVFGRQILRLEMEDRNGQPMQANLKLHAFPGVRFVTGNFSSVKVSRTRELLSDGNDDLFLSLNQEGPFRVSQRGRDFALGRHESVICSCSETIEFERITGRSIGVRVARAGLAPHIRNIDDTINRHLPAQDGIMALMRNYLEILESGSPFSTTLADLAATHIRDLVALSLGARPDYAEVAQARGLKAARLHAIKATIGKNLKRQDLSVVAIAAVHRLTPRHVQRLFEAEGTTFSQFVLDERLALVRKALTAADQAQRSIGDMAYDAGFGDISYFNKAFRRRFGASPSEIRWRNPPS